MTRFVLICILLAAPIAFVSKLLVILLDPPVASTERSLVGGFIMIVIGGIVSLWLSRYPWETQP